MDSQRIDHQQASDDTWVDINPKSGGSGPNTLTITLQTNTTGEDRSATITISCLGQQTTFTITQSASTESGVTPGVYYQVNGSSEWVNKLDPNTSITSLKVETRGGALLTEEIVQQFADLSLSQLDMSNAIYESHTFPRPQDDPFETISFATLEAVTLPVNVTAIGGWTFSHSPLTEINLQQIDSIGRSAFMDCAQLTSVTLSSSLHTLSESTFANTGLEEITLPQIAHTDSRFRIPGQRTQNRYHPREHRHALPGGKLVRSVPVSAQPEHRQPGSTPPALRIHGVRRSA